MGIFDFLKGQFIDVIEWVDFSRDILMWKFPDQDKEIKMGAQLTVRESQAAVLINEGKMADVFEPGRYELTTRNMPILTSLESWKYGFESPFKVDVYFFNTRQFIDNKWGTPTPVYVPDAKFGQVEFRSFGTYNFRIRDFEVFFKEMAGTNPSLMLEDIAGALKGKLVDRFTEIVAEMAGQGFSFVEMQAQKSEFVAALLPRMSEYFGGFGLELTDFSIQSITLPDEVNEFLRKNTQMNMVGDMQRFMQFQAATSLEKSASNPSGGNAGMDMGAGLAMGQILMNQMNQSQPQAQPQQPAESKEDVVKLLKDLNELKSVGILSEEEFEAKKKDLLARL
jgi:membrane protease subunit (stomatin/prohibitin family)